LLQGFVSSTDSYDLEVLWSDKFQNPKVKDALMCKAVINGVGPKCY